MALAADIQLLARHLVDVLNDQRSEILDSNQNPCFKMAVYGEPKVITEWPTVSVEPVQKTRDLGATQKFSINFELHVILYHGEVASTDVVQEGAHQRTEAVETFFHGDYKWNFIDSSDSTLDQVIFGHVALIDHPVVIAPDNQMWSASRLVLRALSQETFTDAGQ